MGNSSSSSSGFGCALVAVAALVLLSLVALYIFVANYYGDDGVRLVGIVLGIAALVITVIALGVGVMWIASLLMMRHHQNVLSGLNEFQANDDRGEIARTVAGGVAGVLRSGNQVDARLLATAQQMMKLQQQASRAQLAQDEDDRQWLALNGGQGGQAPQEEW